MQKSPDAFRTISEVAESLDVPQHVLRFWESKFPQVRPMKRAGGRRYYRPDDVDLLRGIRTLLYGEGYTIKGVQKVLREAGNRQVAEIGRLGPTPGGRLVLAARMGIEAERAGLQAGPNALPKARVLKPQAHLDAVVSLKTDRLSLDAPADNAQILHAGPQQGEAGNAGEGDDENGDDAPAWDAGDGKEDLKDQGGENEEFDEDVEDIEEDEDDEVDDDTDDEVDDDTDDEVDDDTDDEVDDDTDDEIDEDDEDDEDDEVDEVDEDDDDANDEEDEESAQEHEDGDEAHASALNQPPHTASATPGGGLSREAGAGSSANVVPVPPTAFISAQTREALEAILKDLTNLRDLLSASGSKAEAAE